MERLLLTNARILTGSFVTEPRALLTEGGRIAKILPPSQAAGLSVSRSVDLEGRYLAPGLIDLHTHGIGGWDFTDCEEEAFLSAARCYVRYGVTSVYPTLAACPDEELEESCALFQKALLQNGEGANLLGLHLEGPYFADRQRGAQNPAYLRAPEPGHYLPLLDRFPQIKRWSAAPELPGGLELGRELRRRGIVASLAHTEADYSQTLAAVESGYSFVTHLYSGMPGVHREGAFRREGTVEAAYLIDRLDVELIADGCHLPPALLRLAYRIKGPDHIALVTDSMRAAGQDVSVSILGSRRYGLPVLIEDDVAKLPDRQSFAGSIATADRLLRTMVQKAEVPLPEAVRMLTATPARIMGISKGVISPGADADLTAFDEKFHIALTVVGGRILWENL